MIINKKISSDSKKIQYTIFGIPFIKYKIYENKITKFSVLGLFTYRLERGRYISCELLWVKLNFNALKFNCIFNQNLWLKFLKRENIEDLINNLKKDLSEESKKVVDTLLYRRTHKYKFSKQEYDMFKKCQKIKFNYKIIKKEGFEPSVFYLKNGLFYLDDRIVKAYLSKGAVIDGGACSGDSALMFSEYKEVKKVYSFEPIKSFYEGLRDTLKINSCQKAEAINLGIDEKSGDTEILGEKCKITSIDDFAKDKKIGCIKLDIEGMETAAIKGALKTIKRDKPLLLICLYHTPQDFFYIKPMLEKLNLGYRFKIVDSEPCNFMVGIHAMLIAY